VDNGSGSFSGDISVLSDNRYLMKRKTDIITRHHGPPEIRIYAATASLSGIAR
jgi:hypothetical protein